MTEEISIPVISGSIDISRQWKRSKQIGFYCHVFFPWCHRRSTNVSNPESLRERLRVVLIRFVVRLFHNKWYSKICRPQNFWISFIIWRRNICNVEVNFWPMKLPWRIGLGIKFENSFEEWNYACKKWWEQSLGFSSNG